MGSQSLVDLLVGIVGRDDILTEPEDLAPFVTDWRGAFTGSAAAVVRPHTVGHVSAIVRTCAQAGAPIVPQGGNTGLAAGATPVALQDAVIVSLARMNAIRDIDPIGNTIVVDAGVILTSVQDAAASTQRFFPLSLAAEGSAMIGGLISTNAGGTAVLRYGSMRALVLGLEVVLPDGRVLDGMRALRKDNAGYDWKQLFIGSEGTLGIVTGAVLRLFPQASQTATALLAVASPKRALDAYNLVAQRMGETLTACELLSGDAVALQRSQRPQARFPLSEAPWYLLLEAASSLPGLAEALESALENAAEEEALEDCIVAQSPAQAAALWEWRESVAESEKRAGPSAKHDVSVAISSIPQFVDVATAAVERAHPGARPLVFGHVGDGNVHFNVLLPADGSATAKQINDTVHAIVRDMRGSVTAEHGIGRYRREELRATRSEVELDTMRAIKHALDPHGIMNPGAVL
jgi:FAD/FMN-containing dehydrogenase